MSEHPDNDLPSTAPDPRVRVAIIAVDDESLSAAVRAVERQVYGIESITVIDPDGVLDDQSELEVVADFSDFVGDLASETDLVWILHGDARPRPDALGALVAEMDRNDASLVGSKIVDSETLDRLESVGSATDVFGEPYTGLDPEEVDLEQYDVVRDVAFVAAVSMLVRRDLLRGLRGIDALLAPVAAGLDFSQRARVAGGRVMVVPSSEVLHDRICREEVESWREWAGRMRSMLKAYRWITLAWVVPIGTVVGLFDGLARLALGTTRPLRDFSRAFVWNLVHLPGSLAARRSVHAVRHVGDEEMFRYQVTGSVRLRALATDIAERFGWVIDDEPGLVEEGDLEDESTAAGPVVVAIGLAAVALATRSFWAGALPQSGFTFRIGDPVVALGGFAGGWNPAGLGSGEPIHASAAFFGFFEWATGGWAGTFRIVAGALLIAAVFATPRLLRELGVSGPSRHLVGIVAVLGVASSVFSTGADLAGWLSVGPTLWTLVLVVLPWPARPLARIGRSGILMVAAAVTGMLAPLAPVVVFIVAVVLWVVVPGVRLGVAARGLIAADIGILAAAPYLVGVSVDELTGSGPAYDFLPSLLVATLIVGVILFGVAFLPAGRDRVVAVGGALLVATVWTPVVYQPRGDLGAALGVLGVVGLVLAVGAALGFDRDGSRIVLFGRGVASVCAAALVVVALGHVVDGRAGFPRDQWTDRLAFTTSLGSEADAARVLVVGSPSDLPGEHRVVDGVSFRVVSVGGPALESARLGDSRLGDEALGSVVSAIAGGELVRPGIILADFGVGWVAVIDDPPFSAAMAAQVDMDELAVSEDLTVFRNSVPASRAIADDGTVWEAQGAALVGPSTTGRVRIADNASPGWEPEWSQDDWANEVSGSEGVASYRRDDLRRALGWVTLTLFAVGLVAAPFSRRSRA
jgi:hypothetical protein